ncbi:uncharacterized protein LOC127417199 [Myxocyprinus asiaticus]|uniref:uncharacterized protein LOC127417199 n=1 Tax=Myxocyprinus asiaticus TaxID=70543 RepID=UPI002222EB5E|nr:uncharacterized protein LOC127417199 [Myxocyprinus asiaticus]
MLQQNNNNNHPCLDMAHRELLHECRRTNVSFTSALEFGAIPLIKGLRAWAMSGGYSKARRKAATAPRAQDTCQQPPENRLGQKSWSGQISSAYGQTLETTTSTTRTPGVRQGGLGALVTVATLKGTEGGGRQTQTRCLFLKAQGRGSYICAVGNQGAGMRVIGPHSHSVILEGTKEEVRSSSRGPRVSHDGTDDGGVLKAKPRAIRKWRKCSKTAGSAKMAKVDIPSECREPGHGDQNNSVISEVTLEPINRTSHKTMPDRITQCEKEKNSMEGSNTISPGSQQSQEDVTELSKDERAHSPTSVDTVAPESTDPQSCCSSAKLCTNTHEQIKAGMGISPSYKCFESCEGPSCAKDDAQRDTEVSKCETDLDSNEHQNIESENKDKNFVADVPNLEGSYVVSKAAQTPFDSPRVKQTIINCSTEPSLGHTLMKTSSEIPFSNIHEHQISRTNDCLLNCENQHSVEAGDVTTQRGGTPDTMMPEGFTGQVHNLVGVESNTLEKKCKPPMCLPQHWEELITEHWELEVQQSDKSSSRGFSTPPASITVTTIHSLPNPAPTSTADIATAIPALNKGEAGARGGDLLPLTNSELQSEPERVDDRDKVATCEESLHVGKEEKADEDEFGAFMQAGGEQLWTDRFQHLATGEDYKSGELSSSTHANEPTSWTSDWTVVQSFQQTESTWTAFSQKTVEQKIVPGGQWWPLTVEKQTLSPLCDVSSVFQEAFPLEKPSCQDPDYIPTLKQLLQGPSKNSNTGKPREQSLLDGLQDLDRMIGVKYKRAESLSCKLLLQSLHLGRPSSECVAVQVKTSARFSPNLPISNQQLAANAKRRLSYDCNRNIMT